MCRSLALNGVDGEPPANPKPAKTLDINSVNPAPLMAETARVLGCSGTFPAGRPDRSILLLERGDEVIGIDNLND